MTELESKVAQDKQSEKDAEEKLKVSTTVQHFLGGDETGIEDDTITESSRGKSVRLRVFAGEDPKGCVGCENTRRKVCVRDVACYLAGEADYVGSKIRRKTMCGEVSFVK